MASKQNGTSIPTPRPPFRRQGSSIGASPHPMTVALAPVSKIDYSVTKGGARTWIVLLVFLFLCSGLYTIFSSKERSENTHSVDLDHPDRGGYSILEHSASDRESIREEEEESNDEDDSLKVRVETVDSDEENVEESPLEDQLFAGLRRKIEDNFQRVKELVQLRDFNYMTHQGGAMVRDAVRYTRGQCKYRSSGRESYRRVMPSRIETTTRIVIYWIEQMVLWKSTITMLLLRFLTPF
ncbi:hypothetical protein KIN20_021985 [Parelaphostrongylus tenuis]|uniref:Uncharacterized protein n=1 Tax=Parelaphostrongylus tenuis TaxID=148309 RepID=A0AAD5QV25_PARTN|nr:hypothetical protein KIN20_021985 [Parelaphostrongylus tenuis]